MELAADGQTGRRLGQLNAIRNAAAIAGSVLVFLGFKFMGFTFQHVFVLSAVGFVIAAALLFSMKPEKASVPRTYLKLHREYNLFYILNVLSGSRKQFFITFAPWVIVNIFHQPTQTIATLMIVGGVIGILFQPLLGWAIDRFGERVVLSSEAVLLVVVCAGYGFAKSLFSENTALAVIIGCYLVDQMLFSVGMARSTYIKKIALQPADVQPALTAAVTIDHIFSISAALLGGVIWSAFGFQYVFILGMVIAVINFTFAMRVRIPANTSSGVQDPLEVTR
jgi:predicted MFS family arabinose efflux permease